jgi:hypothetical protein
MPLQKPFKVIPTDIRDWTRFFETVEVIPDDESTGTDQLENDSVTNTKLRNSAGTSVIGRASGTTGDPADIVASSNGEYLRRSGGVLGFGGIADADLPATIARDAEVTAALVPYLLTADLLAGILAVDGAGSGLDADLLDAQSSAFYLARANHTGTQAMASISDLPTLAAGVYTPTLTNVANLDASTAYECQYLRVGSVVHVSGRVDIDPTTAATLTQLGITLPVASNLGADEDCAGAAFASGIAAQGAAIRGDATNDRAELAYIAVDVTNQPMYFTFSYQVI